MYSYISLSLSLYIYIYLQWFEHPWGDGTLKSPSPLRLINFVFASACGERDVGRKKEGE